MKMKVPISLRYDRSADVLYLSFGDPRPAIAVEVNDGDFIRVEPFTDKLVGITFVNFKERFMKDDQI